MKKSVLLTCALSLALALAPALSDAKRLGAGKSSGMQRDMPSRMTPSAPPAKPAQPAQQQATPQTPATPAPAAPKRSWMGPLAGLAAGLGLGALLSHFGLGGALGGAFGSLLMIALLAFAAFMLYRMFARRGQAQPAFGGGMARTAPAQVAWPSAPAPQPAASPRLEPAPIAAAATPAATRAFVPASFDSDGFARTAKALFIRLQAANDSGDLDDLRRFTTPEMFAELKLDLQDRQGAAQQTDVVRVDAEVLDLEDDGRQQIVSVRYHGQVREAAGAAAEDFDEVWHLVKPNDDSRSWAIAGIEQQVQKARS